MLNSRKQINAYTIRTLYTIAALVALSICTVRLLDVMVFKVTSNDECAWLPIEGKPELLIKDVAPGGVSDQAGIKDGDILLKINGRGFKGNAAQLILDSVKLGDYATYLVERNGVPFETKVKILKVFDTLSLSRFLLGLGFLIVGYVVVMTKPQGYVQRLFGRYGVFSMLLFGLFIPAVDANDPIIKRMAILGGAAVGRIFAPTVFIQFFLHFPVKHKIVESKWLRPLLYLTSTAAVFLLIFNNQLKLSQVFLISVVNLPLMFFTVGLAIFIVSYYRFVDVTRRNELRPILSSVGVGVITFTYIIAITTFNRFAIYLNPILITPGILLIFLPAGFGYAIFRYRLMDIDLIIKRSLIYGVVTATVAVIYLMTVVGIGNLFSYFFGTEENKAFNILAFVIIAFVFDPIKRRAQDAIDRLFYRERRNYQKALLEFSQELPRKMDLDQILNSMVNRISSTMQVDKVAVVLCGEKEGCYSKTNNIAVECCTFDHEPGGLLALLEETKKAQSFALIEEEQEHFLINETDREKINRAGIALAVPMFLQDRIIGMINVGPKLSGKVYSQEDIDLLMTVASQAAIAIENARLHISDVEKQRIEEELKLAWKIQQGLLPKSSPSLNGLDIVGTTLPARTVGGDYYDFIMLGPKKLLIIVADVSGKGVSAALYMSKVQGMVQLAAQMYSSPKEILTHVNRSLYDGMERKSFITMIAAVFDLDNKEVIICRAGHNKAIVGTNGQLHFVDAAGIGLGLERGPIFESELEEVHQPMSPHGLFMFYTDGLTEAMDDQKNLFGEDQLCTILKTHANSSAGDLQRSIIRAVNEFQGAAEQHDDVTFVIVKTS